MRISILVTCLALLPSMAGAQQDDPVQDLIDQAQLALDGLRYDDAAAIGRSLLDTGEAGHSDIAVAALQILAAASYPEELERQRPALARQYLERLIWRTPEVTLPRAMSWPGLDSLFERARAQTFVVYAATRPRYAFHGVGARLSVPVESTRPSKFRLVATPLPTGDPVVLDSIGPSLHGELHGRILAEDGPRLASGRYELRFEAVDTATGASVGRRFEMTVDAPPLELLVPPGAVLPDQLLPERTRRRPVRHALVGAALGIATAIVATSLRGADPVGGVSADRRAFLIGASLSTVAISGALFDKGRALPANAALNLRVREEHRVAVDAVAEENARRRSAYEATIVIGRERR